ncbi:MAG TPA: DNA polymerase III subunit gamma/tau [Gemmatimonadales bacterium]|nr:DNA polymerase III subunit gamma/tau [Gemmatimonadales bacterium]
MIALARKYRPKRFADLIAQDHVAAALRGAVAQGRPAHGYLFAGPRGVGKTTAARILAMALNCERKSAGAGEPCGECDACLRTWNGSAGLDVVELDAASNRGVDDARDLRERAMYAASTEGHHKVYIVDEAHMLTREAWNALLKILEEPPPRVVFVFATTEPHKIAQTAAPVLSRLQRFDFRRIGPHAIVERLQAVVRAEHIAAADDALHLIAKSADGGMRDALSVLDQVLSFGAGPVSADRVRAVLGLIPDELYGEMLRLVSERDAAAVFPLVERLLEAGADLGEFVDGAGETLRALLVAGLGGQPEGLTEGLAQVVRSAAARLPPPDVVRLLGVLGEMEVQIRRGGSMRLAVELLLLRWAMMDRTVELGEVLAALGKGEVGRGKGPAPAPAPQAPPQLRDVAPPVPLPPSPPPSEKGPATLERLRALWPRIVADMRAENPMIASLVAEAALTAVAGGVVTLTLGDAHHAEGVDRKRDALAQVIGRHVTEPVRVRVTVSGEPGAGGAVTAPPRGERLTAESANAERLKVLRQKDPTLNAAADALDLELLE